ncbi:MAG: PhoH family protein [Aestuariivita sp.]|nr:PhoH family protein [Aestuariivita sp.]MCY4346831.1 PhoH family protein [Aestuariivita sp.]
MDNSQEPILSSSALPAAEHANPGDELLLEFADNRSLAELCGAYDRNLAKIEGFLGVQILRRGNLVTIFGEPTLRRQSARVLQTLYERIEQGRSVEPEDVDHALQWLEINPETCEQVHIPQDIHDRNIRLKTRKKLVEPRTRAQQDYAEALLQHELGFGIGPAGTGKTYLAVAVGVSMFLEGQVERIILSRPAVEAGEKLGYLPGDMKDKVDPYMQPLYDALNDFLPVRQVSKLIEENRIEIAPLAFMRGRSLSNAFVVLDEAQNATKMQMKMFLTRLGHGSRMVITGDRTQIDLPRNIPSGLVHAESLLKGVENISFSYFSSRDVVRHPLVAKIIEAYDAEAAAASTLPLPAPSQSV